MKPTNIHDAKTHFSRLIEQVTAGEEIVIAKAGTPVAKLVPYHEKSKRVRKAGALKGKITVAPDFDEIPVEWVDAFYNGKLMPDGES